MSALSMLLAGLALAVVVMAALWLVQRRTGNAGIVDVGWALTIASLAVLYAWLASGDPLRRGLVALMGGLWGLRLGLHIHLRSHGRPEDGRYRKLREEWGEHVQYRMFRFYQMQALAAAAFSMPFALSASNAAPTLHALEVAGLALWAVGLLGESAADLQLEAWKRDASKQGKTCRAGLWNYSRHPNYFFESLIWCGVAAFAFPSPHGWLAIACPASIFYLLFRVTGIPATEEQALRTRGDDYRRYQAEVSAFFPWFPKKGRAA